MNVLVIRYAKQELERTQELKRQELERTQELKRTQELERTQELKRQESQQSVLFVPYKSLLESCLIGKLDST